MYNGVPSTRPDLLGTPVDSFTCRDCRCLIARSLGSLCDHVCLFDTVEIELAAARHCYAEQLTGDPAGNLGKLVNSKADSARPAQALRVYPV